MNHCVATSWRGPNSLNPYSFKALSSPWTPVMSGGSAISNVACASRISADIVCLGSEGANSKMPAAKPSSARSARMNSTVDLRARATVGANGVAFSLPVQGSHGCVDYAVEGVGISEGLMGQMACFEIVPDNLDVVEFGCVFWQPLDGEPVFARLDGFKSELADMDRPVVLDQYDRFYCPSWLRTEQMVELLEVSDKVAAALGLARMHNQLARDMIE